MTAAAPHPITLLLVDDSELVRSGLKVLLGNLEHADRLKIVGEAVSVASAIAETERLRPDLILLDLRLPDGSGLEACRQILVRFPNTRILILTSVIDDALVQEALSSGAHGYLSTPRHFIRRSSMWPQANSSSTQRSPHTCSIWFAKVTTEIARS